MFRHIDFSSYCGSSHDFPECGQDYIRSSRFESGLSGRACLAECPVDSCRDRLTRFCANAGKTTSVVGISSGMSRVRIPSFPILVVRFVVQSVQRMPREITCVPGSNPGGSKSSRSSVDRAMFLSSFVAALSGQFLANAGGTTSQITRRLRVRIPPAANQGRRSSTG